jgi:hypothetical protein
LACFITPAGYDHVRALPGEGEGGGTPMPVKAPVINTTGLLILRFLMISGFLPAKHGLSRRETDKAPAGFFRGCFHDRASRNLWRLRQRLYKLGGHA